MTGSNSKKIFRDFYSLMEAAALLDTEAEDLIHQAANGLIPLYVIADNWKAQRIYQYDPTIELDTNPENAMKVSFRGHTPPEIPDPDDPELEAKSAIWLRTHDCQDLVCGNLVNYGKHGGHAALYQLILDGLVPVAKHCIKEYLIRPDTAEIEIDMFQFFKMVAEAKDMFFIPENKTLIQDAINKKKLVIKSEDIKQVTGGIDPEVDKPKGGVSRKSLLKLVIGMAISVYGLDPNKRNDVLSTIVGDLERAGVPLDPQTIRDALKEASNHLPSKPH